MKLTPFVLVFLFFTINVFANNPTDPVPKTVTLCSGQTYTWEEFQAYKARMAERYDDEVDFISFEINTVNNNVGAWSSIIDMPIIPIAAASF